MLVVDFRWSIGLRIPFENKPRSTAMGKHRWLRLFGLFAASIARAMADDYHGLSAMRIKSFTLILMLVGAFLLLWKFHCLGSLTPKWTGLLEEG
jgi:hypothetical protein